MSHFRSLKQKLIDPENLIGKIDEIKCQGKTLATLNGSFDLMHAGHLEILYQASKQADILIVGLNSDESIKKYKSPKRPIVALQYRLELMAALEMVDYVTWFEETDPRELLKKIRPHVHVNGAEYGENCIESDVLKEIGTRLHLVDRIPGLATSEIIEKVIQCV